MHVEEGKGKGERGEKVTQKKGHENNKIMQNIS